MRFIHVNSHSAKRIGTFMQKGPPLHDTNYKGKQNTRVQIELEVVDGKRPELPGNLEWLS